MVNRIVKLLAAAVLIFFLAGWGSTGHRIINSRSVLFFPTSMSPFIVWQDSLSWHASDADYRKSEDPLEYNRHFIDIDLYPMFLSQGRIPSTLDSVLLLYGKTFVDDAGILPWATLAAYDSLVRCFKKRNWRSAMLVAADLGHYVADGHNPLHLTANYNGQLTGQTGIHSRYESNLIGRFQDKLVYPGSPAVLLPDVSSFIFGYIYTNYRLADSILSADLEAASKAGNTSSDQYYTYLWQEADNFTILLFASASEALSSLIFTAWDEAGRPAFGSTVSLPGYLQPGPLHFEIRQNENGQVIINCFINKRAEVQLELYDLHGRKIKSFKEVLPGAGWHSIDGADPGLLPGLYLCRLTGQDGSITARLLVTD